MSTSNSVLNLLVSSLSFSVLPLRINKVLVLSNELNSSGRRGTLNSLSIIILKSHKMTIARPCKKDSTWITMEERDLLECCGSIKFATEMAFTSPFSSLQHALDVASDIWCNKINSPFSHEFYISAPSFAIDSSIEEIYALSMQHLQRHGFLYFTISSDWDVDVILMDLKISVKTKPACVFEWAQQHIANFFQKRGYVRSTTESPEAQTAVKDFDLNKKPFWKEDLDPIAREKARRFCDIWYPGEYYVNVVTIMTVLWSHEHMGRKHRFLSHVLSFVKEKGPG
ncbi:hypothetical protein Ahy_A04g017863 [Arachis hypogaea]|uniref:Uncharacterized protein n=1 Tax=Arachis hypogaea TaxID=3818 RepID=A0A445DC82_ARAHY|nr:hypothetical protein Ahy_A04g017863 [Arachis hypogaea]